MKDMVHMSDESFNALGGKIRETITNWLIGKKRKAAGGEPYAKRLRADGRGSTPTAALTTGTGPGARKLRIAKKKQ